MTKRLIVLDGLIGAGKTTYLKKYGDLCVIFEPTEEWESSGKLEKFYSNPQIYAFEWQEYVLQSLIQHIRSNLDGSKLVLVERGHTSAFRVFTHLFWTQKMITDFQYYHLKAIHDAFNNELAEMGYSISYVYLETDLEVCMQRIEDRKRPGESVTKQFQESLLRRYNEIFTKKYSCSELDALIRLLDK